MFRLRDVAAFHVLIERQQHVAQSALRVPESRFQELGVDALDQPGEVGDDFVMIAALPLYPHLVDRVPRRQLARPVARAGFADLQEFNDVVQGKGCRREIEQTVDLTRAARQPQHLTKPTATLHHVETRATELQCWSVSFDH